ncbi:hypothetical protein OUZ56_001888 [Daphnia magna]|uniref:Uncharacterized protein n=1 Tax=Daphnia magna TaxID=35525 RepID=A0ABR0A426_9CRUS|nr:hypothetical protein OUZ56_001888 [Daphnia magna]
MGMKAFGVVQKCLTRFATRLHLNGAVPICSPAVCKNRWWKNLLTMLICTMPASLSNLEMTYEQTTQY